ncbi:transposase family protein [Glycomyces luteolus]|uniref:Transposase family protein n=1 Tax=Glycomyces luteolus TaxID=2670330 RepID=A0A9X3PCF9_9ACTN|nr:transposase family protein [Glycomyces luteolus]MDA1361202.1 transposase family protein [Glycomyces luteolus]
MLTRLGPLDADRIADLRPYLDSVPDPRSRRGQWYSLTAILLICACAVVSGAKSIDELAEWGQRARTDLLEAIGIRRHLLRWRRSPRPRPSAASSNASTATRSTPRSAPTWPTNTADPPPGDAHQATPEHLAAFVRGQWGIENSSHHIRDVTFGEDSSTVHAGTAPRAMAAFRNLATGALKILGATNIAKTTRAIGEEPERALPILGISYIAGALRKNTQLSATEIALIERNFP